MEYRPRDLKDERDERGDGGAVHFMRPGKAPDTLIKLAAPEHQQAEHRVDRRESAQGVYVIGGDRPELTVIAQPERGVKRGVDGDRIIYGEAQAYKLPMLKMEGSVPARLSVYAQDLL